MGQIDSLNTQYIKRRNTATTMGLYLRKIDDVWNSSSFTAQEKISVSVNKLKEMIGYVECQEEASIEETISLCDKYLKCLSDINEYKFIVKNTGLRQSSKVQLVIRKVASSQKEYVNEKESFCKRNDVSINSVEALGRTLYQSLVNAIDTETKAIEKLKKETLEILGREPSIELDVMDPLNYPIALHETMIVGCQETSATHEILKDMGISNKRNYVMLNLREKGNLLLKTDFKHKDDEKIDAFVIAYILRFIESFPIGAVCVHIFKRSKSTLYGDLTHPFDNPKRSDAVKTIMQFTSDYNELSRFEEVTCEEISVKLDYKRPDLYSIYEYDNSDMFHLIVLRDGLTGNGGFSQKDVLETIRFLSEPGKTGHNCGLRFLIVDPGRSYSDRFDEETEYIIGKIQENCELTLDYHDGEWYEEKLGKKDAITKPLSIKGDLRQFITERSIMVADAIEDREKGVVSFDEVFATEVEKDLDNILYIPIGLSGSEIFEIPFSCANVDRTVAGECIGYMVLGLTGSGKGSFFNSVVLNGCMKYSPRDLQFWLLDFKFGTETAKFKESKIPHIKIISDKNRKEDASYLFQMILDEMERRSNIFQEHNARHIAEYNKIAKAEGIECFPRIIIIIDEVQDIFLQDGNGIDNGARTVKDLISGIVARMRFVGMHFVMISQNLGLGNSHMLKDAFLYQVTGRVCFKLDPSTLRDSGFGEEFTFDRRQEIPVLSAGEAYVSYGKNTIKKVQMAFAGTQEMINFFPKICDRYPEDTSSGPLIIGATSRLSVTDAMQGAEESYMEYIKSITPLNGVYQAVIGESVYGMSPMLLEFAQNVNSTVLLLGGNRKIASSLCTSITISLLQQDVKLYLMNGDRQNEIGSTPHPFKFVCEKLASNSQNAEVFRPNQLIEVMKILYSEYLDRKSMDEKTVNEKTLFTPVFLIINDLTESQSFLENAFVEIEQGVTDKQPESNSTVTKRFSFDIPEFSNGSPVQHQRKNLQDILYDLLENGNKYNIHSVVAIKKYPDVWRQFYTILENNNHAVYFNEDKFTKKITGASELKGKLISISNSSEGETVALWSSKGVLQKIRPLLYEISDNGEQNAIATLMNMNS